MANENLSVYDRICRTRKSGRATASDYINATITDFVELHGASVTVKFNKISYCCIYII